ncbi:methyltransferase type 11 [Salipaludibacillus keqinensis]|uniref:Methyltransferase type 11 n=1 Tax=Salipaludibacillus keqinensis TaxID=2045207 RepID=A0A323TN93_9BACI|nr:class I SAM-dependent methyltransferase [Salipaludibacillus keqinensis]PYZ94223.1 methyltransferase type 11 [Salipaludibacillus keqinensis]
MTHDHFASLYDVLMEDAPYDSWLEYAEKYVHKEGSILDLACGTGTLTMMLANRGYEVTGVDVSQDMLTVAERKARKSNADVRFILQDMRELEGFNQLDGVTIFCDGLNYLTKEEEVIQTFRRIASSLKPGGVLLFDVHSPFKMEHIFDHQLYGENSESLSYMWFCEPNKESLSVHHSLTFFIKKDEDLYERMDEEQFQRTFLPSTYHQWLEEAGFHRISISADFGNKELEEEDDRIFFKAVKK